MNSRYPFASFYPTGLLPVTGDCPPKINTPVRQEADVVAVCVHTLGFWPRNSLVLLTVGSPGVGPLLRIDLPVAGEEDYGEYFDFFLSQLPQSAADPDPYNRLFAVFFGSTADEMDKEREVVAPYSLDYSDCSDNNFIDQVQVLIPPLHRCLDNRSIDLIDVIAVGHRFLWALHPPELTLLPATPTASVVDSPIYREMFGQGSDVARSHEEFLEKYLWDPMETADVSRRDSWLAHTEFAALRYLTQKAESDVGEYHQIRAELMMWDAALQRGVEVMLGYRSLGVDNPKDLSGPPHRDVVSPAPADLMRTVLNQDVGAYLIASLNSTATVQLVIYLACTGLQEALAALENISCRLEETATVGLGKSQTIPVLPQKSSLNRYGLDRKSLLNPVETKEPADSAAIASMASKLCGHDTLSPNWDRLAALCAIATILEEAAHHKPESLLKLAQAWAHWLQGKSTLADYLLRAVEPIHHGNEPTVLHRVLDAGVLPVWLSARPQPNI